MPLAFGVWGGSPRDKIGWLCMVKVIGVIGERVVRCR